LLPSGNWVTVTGSPNSWRTWVSVDTPSSSRATRAGSQALSSTPAASRPAITMNRLRMRSPLK